MFATGTKVLKIDLIVSGGRVCAFGNVEGKLTSAINAHLFKIYPREECTMVRFDHSRPVQQHN